MLAPAFSKVIAIISAIADGSLETFPLQFRFDAQPSSGRHRLKRIVHDVGKNLEGSSRSGSTEAVGSVTWAPNRLSAAYFQGWDEVIFGIFSRTSLSCVQCCTSCTTREKSSNSPMMTTEAETSSSASFSTVFKCGSVSENGIVAERHFLTFSTALRIAPIWIFNSCATLCRQPRMAESRSLRISWGFANLFLLAEPASGS